MRTLLTALLALPLLLPATLAACDEGDYCGDVSPNAWVSDVLYDDRAETLYVALSHHLSYCTGTDEKKFSHELITVDLVTGEATFAQRASNDSRGYSVPDRCCALYYDGHFGNADRCAACELVLNSNDAAAYTFRFTTRDDYMGAMYLDITRGGEPVVTIDIGGYRSAVHVPEDES
ncbi:MAG: hypothetical protein EP329_25620 [Deltaproteobacteria bacterium]|nr:MAG: hypothetical protein EP329_25620 [Deltaproteobacteria bacterium]